MSYLESPFSLTDGERVHPLWTKLRTQFEKMLHDQRGKLEGDQTEQQTAIARGHIRCLRSVIALGDESPPIDGME